MNYVYKDIINNCKHNGIYEQYQHILDNITDYDYDQEWVEAPAAYGDTYKYTVTYTIGDFKFTYYHVLASELDSASFTIQCGDITEELFNFNLLRMMMIRAEGGEMPKYPLNNNLLSRFKDAYKLDVDDRYYLLFSILNAFTLGQCISIRVFINCDTQELSVEMTHEYLRELIEVISLNTPGDSDDGDDSSDDAVDIPSIIKHLQTNTNCCIVFLKDETNPLYEETVCTWPSLCVFYSNYLITNRPNPEGGFFPSHLNTQELERLLLYNLDHDPDAAREWLQIFESPSAAELLDRFTEQHYQEAREWFINQNEQAVVFLRRSSEEPWVFNHLESRIPCLLDYSELAEKVLIYPPLNEDQTALAQRPPTDEEVRLLDLPQVRFIVADACFDIVYVDDDGDQGDDQGDDGGNDDDDQE